MILKELISNSSYFGRVWWSLKNSFSTLPTLGGSDGLDRIQFSTVSTFWWLWWS